MIIAAFYCNIYLTIFIKPAGIRTFQS